MATSDAEGHFVLPHVPLGEIAVRAWAAGFELGESAIHLRAEVDVVLGRGKGRTLEVVVHGDAR